MRTLRFVIKLNMYCFHLFLYVKAFKAQFDKHKEFSSQNSTINSPINIPPSSSIPSGSIPSGSFPSGSFPSGSFPSGSFPSGSFPFTQASFPLPSAVRSGNTLFSILSLFPSSSDSDVTLKLLLNEKKLIDDKFLNWIVNLTRIAIPQSCDDAAVLPKPHYPSLSVSQVLEDVTESMMKQFLDIEGNLPDWTSLNSSSGNSQGTRLVQLSTAKLYSTTVARRLAGGSSVWWGYEDAYGEYFRVKNSSLRCF